MYCSTVQWCNAQYKSSSHYVASALHTTPTLVPMWEASRNYLVISQSISIFTLLCWVLWFSQLLFSFIEIVSDIVVKCYNSEQLKEWLQLHSVTISMNWIYSYRWDRNFLYYCIFFLVLFRTKISCRINSIFHTNIE